MAPIAAPQRPADMAHRLIGPVVAAFLVACTGGEEPTSSTGMAAGGTAPELPEIARVTCDGGPAFALALLDRPGAAERAADPAAAALRAHVTGGGIETEWLPDTGWIETARSADAAQYVSKGDDGEWYQVGVELRDGDWMVDGWGGCALRPEIPPGVGLARFRVAPGVELTRDAIEISVLVTEMACNSGQDARGRIRQPLVLTDAESVTVVMTVRPRGGGQECPSNPETPFLLELPEPLGDRALLDGSEVPPRDATECPEAICP